MFPTPNYLQLVWTSCQDLRMELSGQMKLYNTEGKQALRKGSCFSNFDLQPGTWGNLERGHVEERHVETLEKDM